MPKNRTSVYPIVRHTFDGNDVVCAVAGSHERADELVGEYTQAFLDRGYNPDEFYFYATSTTYYD